MFIFRSIDDIRQGLVRAACSHFTCPGNKESVVAALSFSWAIMAPLQAPNRKKNTDVSKRSPAHVITLQGYVVNWGTREAIVSLSCAFPGGFVASLVYD